MVLLKNSVSLVLCTLHHLHFKKLFVSDLTLCELLSSLSLSPVLLLHNSILVAWRKQTHFKLNIDGSRSTQMMREQDEFFKILRGLYWQPNAFSWGTNPYFLQKHSRYGRVCNMLDRLSADTNATINLVEPESISIYLSQAVHRHGYVRSSGWDRRRYLTHVQMIDGQVPQRRPDGWMEIFLGKFFNDEGEGETEIKLLENKILNWKRGLILEGIELRPKEDR